MSIYVVGFLIVFLVYYLTNTLRIVREYERGVIFRLGRVLAEPKGPGLIVVFWPIDKMVKIDLRVVTLDVPPQEVITRDNVSVNVNAVTYFRVVDPQKAVLQVENFFMATSQLAQTTLRSVLGEVELDDLLSQRDQINRRLQEILDKQTDPWGIKVSLVEVKQVDLPDQMRRALAKQAEAERERRAKIIHAEGELTASVKLVEAASAMATEPISVQLRYLQTLADIGAEQNTTIVFPLPLDMFKALIKPDETP
jgi:regulator of protease activity HflC (stomatin/prohibitin superfamily)